MSTSQQWLRTPMAAMALGCSQNHLKRCRDTHGGFLVGGEHYILGTSHSAAILWNVDSIRDAFHYRGIVRQRGEAALKQAVGA
ncbi:hypothetical protein KBY57_12550 [Cyanobium sp. Aljojuca 7D2]|uniref:hypothetical protein n=1 Tax=Cyanobium sp. Aljojuca 7D2 TaxID=2823698 RepID=UPI0020CBD022|nr:hypothetical protein [Cyanobium sp. Aljojuca 7D2]MCP9891874.1 hypothetical protein [Cyanobium sp. Aljojuca 7D2]